MACNLRSSILPDRSGRFWLTLKKVLQLNKRQIFKNSLYEELFAIKFAIFETILTIFRLKKLKKIDVKVEKYFYTPFFPTLLYPHQYPGLILPQQSLIGFIINFTKLCVKIPWIIIWSGLSMTFFIRSSTKAWLFLNFLNRKLKTLFAIKKYFREK